MKYVQKRQAFFSLFEERCCTKPSRLSSPICHLQQILHLIYLYKLVAHLLVLILHLVRQVKTVATAKVVYQIKKRKKGMKPSSLKCFLSSSSLCVQIFRPPPLRRLCFQCIYLSVSSITQTSCFHPGPWWSGWAKEESINL